MIRIALFVAIAAAMVVGSALGAEGPDDGRQTTLNPDISVILDGYYHYDDADEHLAELLGEIDGFGHHHHGHAHEHAAPFQNGFNLRHAEIVFSATVDPYFYSRAIVAVDSHGAEVEELMAETTSLPAGMKLKFGKFFSDFGRINWQHPHQWDFLHQPLAHRLIFGGHGLNDIGLQFTWLPPTESYLLFGVEAFQGNEQPLWTYQGAEESEGVLDDVRGPRIGVAWLKYSPDLGASHAVEVGVSGGAGVRQEIHDEDADGTADLWLDGAATFAGAHIVYKYDDPAAYGRGDWELTLEYMHRWIDLEVERADLDPSLAGNATTAQQSGLYLQAVHGFAPRWRVGARYDAVGLVNKKETPEGDALSLDDSFRTSLMLDYSPTEFSRLRLAGAYGSYAIEDEPEEVWEASLQLIISIGEHGAHRF